MMILGAALYFGWNYVEAVLIALPIPDPKDIKEKITKMINRDGATGKKHQDYSQKFDAPESLGDDDEEDDVGKPINLNSGNGGLNYDSDEDKDPSNELISLGGDNSRDRSNTAANSVPKLKKPKK